MRYIKRAEMLFFEQKGEPPYSNRLVEAHHAQILYLLSQARLNLDDYAGALSVLDTIKSYGYFTPSYAGSRAWVLMKLGRVDEAIREAKMGLLMRAEPARTLNMLGILLSMNNQPEAALEALKRAAAIETSLGKQGQPATPINNSGEVYKEMFEDEKAEASWLKAKSFHDGCEHVLPSLNLALLYLDQLKLRDAEDSISTFLSCVAQYTLRSDEEHRALVNLARARFKLHGGKPDEALKQLHEAFDNIQWFGKIGTNQDDLEIGITITKAQAWQALAERLRFKIPDGTVESMRNRVLVARARIASWWFFRKAARVLVERLKNIEDLTIRNTDSLIEYSTFGSVLSVIPSALFERRLAEELERDKRPSAQVYYNAYKGENYLLNGKRTLGITTLKDALNQCRPTLDDGLRLRILILLASVLESTSSEYAKMLEQIFLLSPSALRNAGLRLPVAITNGSSRTVRLLKKGGFLPVEPGSTPFSIEEVQNGASGLNLVIDSGNVQRTISSQGDDLAQVINNLNEAAFTVARSPKKP
jgi:tetratricopeptide (TPR) repeat protein